LTTETNLLYQLYKTRIKQCGTLRSVIFSNDLLWVTLAKALLASRAEIQRSTQYYRAL